MTSINLSSRAVLQDRNVTAHNVIQYTPEQVFPSKVQSADVNEVNEV